jgi:hypothetical protein
VSVTVRRYEAPSGRHIPPWIERLALMFQRHGIPREFLFMPNVKGGKMSRHYSAPSTVVYRINYPVTEGRQIETEAALSPQMNHPVRFTRKA